MSKPRFLLASLVLATILGGGIEAVYGLLVGWAASIVEQLFGSDYSYEQLAFRTDGTPLIATYSSRNYQDRTAQTLDGKPVPPEELERSLNDTRLGPPRPPNHWFTPGWSERIIGFNDGRYPPIYWYFIYRDERGGSGYFVGFDSKSKLRVGYLGAGGFRDDMPPTSDWFPLSASPGEGDLSLVMSNNLYSLRGRVPEYWATSEDDNPLPNHVVHMLSANRLMEVDLRHRTVRTMMESPELVALGRGLRAKPPGQAEPFRQSRCLIVLDDNRVLVFDADKKEQRSYVVPDKIRGRRFGFLELADNRAILEMTRRPRDPDSPLDLYWIDPSGKVQNHVAVTLKHWPISDPRFQSAGASLLLPVPAFWTAIGVIATIAMPLAGEAPDYPSALVRVLREGWPAGVLSFLLAIIAAWYARRRQRDYAAGGTWAWVAFVFLLGPPALAGYLLHRVWPPRLPCPNCHAVVPRDRDSCAVCGHPFPAPAAKGIEVYA